ncbi:MAG: hypothetical protein HRU19_27310 [Pseudobacteriovorax sp.]|nr:hypothetical protein [Pseudobacteriovorax sp.]
MKRILVASLLLVASACSEKEDKSDNSSQAAAGGSCLTVEFNSDLESCYQISPSSATFSQECQLLGGTFQASSCDESKYDKVCEQPTEVSVNGGPETTVIYSYYRKAESEVLCAGEEKDL